jgi:geranylgeranyl diphosphate synthase type II
MKKIEEYYSLINNQLDKINLPVNPPNLYEPIRYVLSLGGKRIRPVLALLANQMFDNNIDQAINPAIGLEIFHNFTLLHDDIMDKAVMRRNKETVHVKWNENVAILSGDTMMILAYQFISRTNEKYLKEILNLFNKTSLEVCEGQQYDMNFETNVNVSEAEYIEMIRLKTSVLIAASLKIGAITGNANTEDAENIYNYGINIGLGFQLQDDLLDTYGDENVFGKKIGNDIVTNKKTFLLISALKKAKGKDYDGLIELLENKTRPDNEKIEKVINLYNKLEIKNLVKEKIEYYFNIAKLFFNKIKKDNGNKLLLENYINNLANRNF